MELNKVKEKYVFTTRIDLDDDEFIELREPTMIEIKDFGEDENENFEVLKKIFPDCIINHSFTENGEKAKGIDVANELLNSGTIYSQILQTWMESVPFKKKRIKK